MAHEPAPDLEQKRAGTGAVHQMEEKQCPRRYPLPCVPQKLRDTLGNDNLQNGTAVAGELGNFVWAVATVSQPRLQNSNEAPVSGWRASKIYPGMKAGVWYYVPAQWDGITALPVQVWGDGHFYTRVRPDPYRISGRAG